MLRENLLTIFERLKEKDPSLTPYRIAGEVILDHSALRKALDGKIRFSDTMLEKLASHPEMDVTSDELKAWRMMDEYTVDQIRTAFRVIEELHQEDGSPPS